MVSGDLTSRVLDVLQSEFPMLAERGLVADTALLSSGLLDSFALVTLIAALEEAFEIDVDVEDVEIEQFETAACIAELCRAASGPESQ